MEISIMYIIHITLVKCTCYTSLYYIFMTLKADKRVTMQTLITFFDVTTCKIIPKWLNVSIFLRLYLFRLPGTYYMNFVHFIYRTV